MKNKICQTVFVCIVGLTAFFCFGKVANAQFINIRQAVFARQFVNGEAQDVKVAFEPGEKMVFCVIGLSDPAPNASFKFVWSFYDPVQRKRSEIYNQELSSQSAKNIASKLSAPKGLVAGFYEVDVSIDGRIRKHLRFPVVKNQF